MTIERGEKNQEKCAVMCEISAGFDGNVEEVVNRHKAKEGGSALNERPVGSHEEFQTVINYKV